MNQFQTALDGFSLITPDLIAANSESPDSGYLQQQFIEGRAELAILLALSEQQFQNRLPAADIVRGLTARLSVLRQKLPSSVWQRLAPIAREHAVAAYLLEDPLTRWSFEKPRGYSGDAQLLDFIYEHPSMRPAIEQSSVLGRDLYAYTKQASSSVAVRERRDLLTTKVDAIASERPGDSEILTIAAGHLREADRSRALQDGAISRWVALDQDPLSVGLVARDFAGSAVEAVNGSVRTLLSRAQQLGRFDFIYAAGLYDYLAHNVAVKLTERCLQMLKPGGQFLFANFARDISVEGYMETFMNWELLWRSESEMWSIIRDLPNQDRFEAKVEFGENRNVVYAILQT
ncbi:class I SAM-dependent methyltransferase [Rhizobium sullae]|uniref:class I SAM-dependent methyltransferase n=1 Tax=Rhizobium sullae TaxID=50338 RepID=UPI000B35652A|nr:class I SAM-dependent methyltransferase [Rhizobium sullae]